MSMQSNPKPKNQLNNGYEKEMKKVLSFVDDNDFIAIMSQTHISDSHYKSAFIHMCACLSIKYPQMCECVEEFIQSEPVNLTRLWKCLIRDIYMISFEVYQVLIKAGVLQTRLTNKYDITPGQFLSSVETNVKYFLQRDKTNVALCVSNEDLPNHASKVITLLIDNGLNLHSCNHLNDSALDLIRFQPLTDFNKQIVKTLVNHNIPYNKSDSESFANFIDGCKLKNVKPAKRSRN